MVANPARWRPAQRPRQGPSCEGRDRRAAPWLRRRERAVWGPASTASVPLTWTTRGTPAARGGFGVIACPTFTRSNRRRRPLRRRWPRRETPRRSRSCRCICDVVEVAPNRSPAAASHVGLGRLRQRADADAPGAQHCDGERPTKRTSRHERERHDLWRVPPSCGRARQGADYTLLTTWTCRRQIGAGPTRKVLVMSGSDSASGAPPCRLPRCAADG